ncbi:hypothetical protein TSUD_119290 [Trifolium subterraneum]|uniref:F-box domain-containing protein n=1 Tax=Trifolium subterraneum TaxID=3900 RepID=A0A2Z6P3K6_TRISU|nr:hypothetical protein TSUD_119290 [Trifolium subterraneum]
MPSSGRSIPTTDRISELPDPILCHILSFLPTKFAATTSILSKRWKPLWLSVQTLDFDDKTFKDMFTLLRLMYSTIFLRDITLPIHSFRFEWNKYCGRIQTDVNQIVNFVLQRGIQNFYLCPTRYLADGIELPLTILSCRTLKRVSFVSHDNFEKLLLGCPILEDFAMKNSTPFKGLDDLASQIMFKALPNLIKARICEFYIPITIISKAKILRLDPKIVTCHPLNILFQTPPMFESLTHLELNFKDINWNAALRWIWLLRMLKYFPKLQNLIIQDNRDLEVMNDKYWEVPSIVPECLSSQVKTCCVREANSCTATDSNMKPAIVPNLDLQISKMTILETIGQEFYGIVGGDSDSDFESNTESTQFSLLKSDSPCLLQDIKIESFHILLSVPKMIINNTCLRELDLYGIQSLTSFPKKGLPTSLQSLCIRKCDNLTFLPPETWRNYTSLASLELDRSCGALTSFPLNCFPMLQSLHISAFFTDMFQIALNIHNCCRNIADVIGSTK